PLGQSFALRRCDDGVHEDALLQHSTTLRLSYWSYQRFLVSRRSRLTESHRGAKGRVSHRAPRMVLTNAKTLPVSRVGSSSGDPTRACREDRATQRSAR